MKKRWNIIGVKNNQPRKRGNQMTDLIVGTLFVGFIVLIAFLYRYIKLKDIRKKQKKFLAK